MKKFIIEHEVDEKTGILSLRAKRKSIKYSKKLFNTFGQPWCSEIDYSDSYTILWMWLKKQNIGWHSCKCEVDGMWIISQRSFLKIGFSTIPDQWRNPHPFLCTLLVWSLPWRKQGEKNHIEQLGNKKTDSTMNVFLVSGRLMFHF